MKTIELISSVLRAACSAGHSRSFPPELGWSLATVKRLEGGFGPNVSDDAQVKLQKALEAAGIEFLDENGGRSWRSISKAAQTEVACSNAAHKL